MNIPFRTFRAHLLFKLWTWSLCVHFKTRKKNFADFLKKNCRFSNFLKFWSFINLPLDLESRNVLHKGSGRFSHFDVYWIQANKHPDRQAKFIYLNQIICLQLPIVLCICLLKKYISTFFLKISPLRINFGLRLWTADSNSGLDGKPEGKIYHILLPAYPTFLNWNFSKFLNKYS